jgi:hypothetical protein
MCNLRVIIYGAYYPASRARSIGREHAPVAKIMEYVSGSGHLNS